MLFEGSFHSCLKFPPMRSCGISALPFAVLNCYFTPREVLASFENNLDVTLCHDRNCVYDRNEEMIRDHYFWRIEPLTCPGTPNTLASLYERCCRHEGS